MLGDNIREQLFSFTYNGETLKRDSLNVLFNSCIDFTLHFLYNVKAVDCQPVQKVRLL